MDWAKNLFSGPTAHQLKDIRNKENVEEKYMNWVHANPDRSIEECKEKYEFFKNTSERNN